MENLTIDVKCKQDIAFTTAKNSNDKYTTEIIYKDDLLPIKKGDVVGTLIVTIDGKEAGSYELVITMLTKLPTFQNYLRHSNLYFSKNPLLLVDFYFLKHVVLFITNTIKPDPLKI